MQRALIEEAVTQDTRATARAVIEEAAAYGARVYLDDGVVKVICRGELPRDFRARLWKHSPEIERELAGPPRPPCHCGAPAVSAWPDLFGQWLCAIHLVGQLAHHA